MSVEKLAHALLESGLVDATTVEARASRARGGRMFLEALVHDGDVQEPALVNQLARSLSVPRYDPKERHPEPDALAALDVRAAEELGVIPVAVRGNGSLLWVAMCDPTDDGLVAEIARRCGRRVKACLIGPRELTKALNQLRGQGARSPVAQAYVPPPPGYGTPPTPVQAVPMPYGQAVAQPLSAPAIPYAPLFPGAQVAPPLNPAVAIPAVPSGQTPAPMHLPPMKSPDLVRLEEELNQAKQVVKVLVQLLVESGLVNGDDLKRRLRAERERK